MVRIPPSGTRGARFPARGPMAAAYRMATNVAVWLYRRLGGFWSRNGISMVLLTTRGAKTGLVRTTPLGGISDGQGAWLVVAALAGAARHPAWLFNMAKHPDEILLEIGRERFRVRARTLEGPDRQEAMRRILTVAPGYGAYETKTDREIPIVRLSRER